MTFGFLKSFRFWIAVAAVVAITAIRFSPLGNFLSLETLRLYRADLTVWVAATTLLASFLYMASYIVVAALALPGAAFLSLAGGFLFGTGFGAGLIAIGATIGATVIFLFARSLFGDRALAKVAAQYPQLVHGIRENAWSYLLAMRFLPLFPFFLVNLAAAVVGVRLSTYMLTTFFGMMPGIVVYSLSGAGLGSVLDGREEFSVGLVFTPTIIAALVGLSVLSLLAILVRNWLSRRSLGNSA